MDVDDVELRSREALLTTKTIMHVRQGERRVLAAEVAGEISLRNPYTFAQKRSEL